MTTFDEREKTFENKFAMDGETAFKVTARRNKLLGTWAAAQLGKTGPEAAEYAKEVALADFQRAGDDDVVEKLAGDFKRAGIAITDQQIRAEMNGLLAVARKQVMENQ